ncbi:hypothetical protein ACFSKW_12835 [Nonomuraea mangrovi]|uniref:Uncharacterized protein n=1 Tax=Nonomuraea mangrovi TaxID=2316207 RepID=A0ABW4ST51_9ACTN
MVPPPDVDADGEMRALPASRIATVSGFLKTLTTLIDFGANAESTRPGAQLRHARAEGRTGAGSRCVLAQHLIRPRWP